MQGTSHLLCGLLAGLIATVPMTFIMFLLFYYLPKNQKFTLPPFHVSRFFLKKLKSNEYEPPKHRALTFVNHFGYGAIAGALFALGEGFVAESYVLKGLIFGLLVWAFSYIFFMPSMGLFPLPERRPLQFNLFMISAHGVWGLFLVLCYLFFVQECKFVHF